LEHNPEKWKPVFRKDLRNRNAGAAIDSIQNDFALANAARMKRYLERLSSLMAPEYRCPCSALTELVTFSLTFVII
jgi:hypothetical protein